MLWPPSLDACAPVASPLNPAHLQILKVVGAPIQMVPVATVSAPAGYQVPAAPAPGGPQYIHPSVPYAAGALPQYAPGIHPTNPQYSDLGASNI